jgi:hypothetical protein
MLTVLLLDPMLLTLIASLLKLLLLVLDKPVMLLEQLETSLSNMLLHLLLTLKKHLLMLMSLVKVQNYPIVIELLLQHLRVTHLRLRPTQQPVKPMPTVLVQLQKLLVMLVLLFVEKLKLQGMQHRVLLQLLPIQLIQPEATLMRLEFCILH